MFEGGTVLEFSLFSLTHIFQTRTNWKITREKYLWGKNCHSDPLAEDHGERPVYSLNPEIHIKSLKTTLAVGERKQYWSIMSFQIALQTLLATPRIEMHTIQLSVSHLACYIHSQPALYNWWGQWSVLGRIFTQFIRSQSSSKKRSWANDVKEFCHGNNSVGTWLFRAYYFVAISQNSLVCTWICKTGIGPCVLIFLLCFPWSLCLFLPAPLCLFPV